MKRLIYTCRNITGAFSGGLLCNLKMLDGSTIDLLTSNKTDQCKIHIEDSVGININQRLNLYGDYYLNTAKYLKDWNEVYNSLDVSPLQIYDAFHIFGGLHFPQSNITRFSKRANIFPADKGQLKFKQTGLHIINVLAIHKAHVLYDIPLHEFSYDSDELCSGLFQVNQNPSKYHLYHIYDMPHYNMYRLDSLQYYLLRKNLIPTDKIYDLTFGYTVFQYGNRPTYIDYVDKITCRFDNVNLYVKNAISGHDTSIPRDVYLNKISESRYTLIIPSYDNSCFSLYRFIESIHLDCLPLIHQDCNIDDVQRSFDVDLSILKTAIPFSEDNRLKLLEYFKSKFLVFEKNFIGETND